MPRLAVMQPYLLPYLGYFQLFRACDEFVIYDDVQYIKRGWVNRNTILQGGQKVRFTAEVEGASQSKDFNEVRFGPLTKLSRTIEVAYRRAPYFDSVFSMIQRILAYEDRRVARLVGYSIEQVLAYLRVEFRLSYASSLRVPKTFRGSARILEICRLKHATAYVNAPGGVDLYDPDEFARSGVDLLFLRPGSIRYTQFDRDFVENLSIIDALMFNAPADVAAFMDRYELVSA